VDFDDFLTLFVERLAADDFYQGSSFTAYLSLPSEQRSNDEADIVDDKIAKLLLKGLGYPQSEWVYNRGGEGGHSARESIWGKRSRSLKIDR
jgi:hypothetical protein